MAATKTIRATAKTNQHGEFQVVASDRALDLNFAQKMDSTLWAPMLLMGMMAFIAAFVLGAVRAGLVDDGTRPATVALLGQFVPAVMFIGFMSVFAAIVFAIARILGVLRTGGGQVQETARRQVLTFKMPATAWGMMMLLFAIIAHLVVGFVALDAVRDADLGRLEDVGTWATWLEGLRRFGVATYLASIALGLVPSSRCSASKQRESESLSKSPRWRLRRANLIT